LRSVENEVETAGVAMTQGAQIQTLQTVRDSLLSRYPRETCRDF